MGWDGVGWEVGGRFKREGTYAYLWLIHMDVWQKPTQYGKAIILQLKINKFQKKWVAVRIKRMFGTSLELCLRIICVIYVTYFNKTQILFLM